MSKDPLKRFSDRVDNYIKFRPGYPFKLINYLEDEFIIKKNDVIADIGSGTGISSELFLRSGYNVIAVEPNGEMREASDKLLFNYSKFKSIDGTSSSTNLDDNSVDVVCAFQAFHWFELDVTKSEFKRILKNDGYAVFVWNTRKEDTEFLKDYESLLQKFGTDYRKVKHNNIDHQTVVSFFEKDFKYTTFLNSQVFDFEGLKGRLLSSSYAPNESETGYSEMLLELERIFNKNNQNGFVSFDYITQVYSGSFNF